jgi:hypothetical protein
LLAPDTFGAGKDPRRPHGIVVVLPANNGRVAIAGQRNSDALFGVVSSHAGAH